MNGFRWKLKAVAVALLCLLLLVPLAMIQGTVAERQRYRQDAVASVARSYAGAQTMAPPVVVVPYQIRVTELRADERGEARPVTRVLSRRWTFFARDAAFEARLQPDIKRRGLHRVRVYELTGTMRGRVEIALPAADPGGEIVAVGTPVLGLAIGDVRGLVGTPTLRVDGAALPLQQGSQLPGSGTGLHAALPALAAGERRAFAYQFDLRLGGSERFAFVPLADSNHVVLASTWPHPNFDGRYSPRQPSISAAGFEAGWDISSLASTAQAQFPASLGADLADGDGPDTIAVTLADPVSIYVQADRATKYGFLFVALTFTGFFMFELVKRLAIHPIQYALVGLALAIFFLLLLSLSEHVEFWLAYLLSSGACIGLLGVYLAGVLRSPARGATFAGMLTLLYGALYGLLVSEDNALVLGALLLFAILAAVMLATRRVDWYALGGPAVAAA